MKSTQTPNRSHSFHVPSRKHRQAAMAPTGAGGSPERASSVHDMEKGLQVSVPKRLRLRLRRRARMTRTWMLVLLASALALLIPSSAALALRQGHGEQDEEGEEGPAAVVDLEVDAWGDVMVTTHDKAAAPAMSFPLPGEEGNWEMYKGFRDIAAAENFTAMDYLSVRGAVLSLTPEDGEPSIFPMCELFKIGAPLRLHCVMIALSMRALTSKPPDLRSASTERQPLPVGGVGRRTDVPPHELKDPPLPVPDFITDQAFIAEEKPVYYWFYRQILNLYEYTYRWNDAGVEDRRRREGVVPMLPDSGGYGNQSLIWMTGPSDMPFRRPFGQCFTYFPDRGGRGGGPHLICVMRGTIYAEEWISDFRLRATEPEEIHGLGLDGLVTSGFFAMLKEILPQVMAALNTHKVPEITLSGHSLGGSMSLLLATYLGHVYPSLKINVVTFGAPNVGDEIFMKAFKKDINVRQLSYIGSGLRGNLKIDPTSYGIGDSVSQMPPDCVAVSPCPLLTARAGEPTGDFYMRVKLHRAPGIVLFYATDLPNSQRWLYWEDYYTRIFTRMDRGLISSHVCSYQCFVASAVGDPETRCYFPEQGPRDPREICDLLMTRGSGEPYHGPGNDP